MGKGLQSKFKRVVIQDSTIINLPQRLFAKFSGVSNGVAQVANARIQLAINILTNNIIQYSLDKYSDNDIKVASQLSVREGDLVLRDRGYFSIPELIRIIKLKAHFIYRYKHGINYCDIHTGKPINLLKKLSGKKITDIWVRLSGIDGPIVRLIAMPVKNEIANTRRAKLKSEAKNYPKEEVLALLSWSIFITSIDDENLDYMEIFKLYKLRWRIEILFKAMKSHLRLDHIHNVSENQLKFIILAKILMIVITLQFIYEILLKPVRQFYNKELSLLKLIRFVIDNKARLDDLITITHKTKVNNAEILKLLAKYCSYDCRKRKNYADHALMALS